MTYLGPSSALEIGEGDMGEMFEPPEADGSIAMARAWAAALAADGSGVTTLAQAANDKR